MTCIGVVLLVVSLEFFRRLGKEYDSAILRQFRRNAAARLAASNPDSRSNDGKDLLTAECNLRPTLLRFRPTLVQQLIRSVIHMVTFAIAYIVMLLAMYFNGYIVGV